MVIWKKRDTRNKFRSFLEYLDSNYCNERKRNINYLRKNFYPYADKLIQDFKREGFVEIKKETINITLKGYEYLDKLRCLILENESLNIEREKILIEMLGIFSIIFTLAGGFVNHWAFKLFLWVIAAASIIFLFILFKRYRFWKRLKIR